MSDTDFTLPNPLDLIDDDFWFQREGAHEPTKCTLPLARKLLTEYDAKTLKALVRSKVKKT